MTLQPIGRVLGNEPQTLASSGPHLHLAIQDESGNYVNPAFYRSIVGKNVLVKGKPLYVSRKKQDGSSEWLINPDLQGATLTSGYGPRNTGIPGASTFHKGADYSGGLLGAGAELAWAGSGSFEKIHPEIGAIDTIDPNSGKKYKVKFMHVAPNSAPWNNPFTGKPNLSTTPPGTTNPPAANTAVGSSMSPVEVVIINPQTGQLASSRTSKQDENDLFGFKLGGEFNPLADAQQMLNNYLKNILSSNKSDPYNTDTTG